MIELYFQYFILENILAELWLYDLAAMDLNFSKFRFKHQKCHPYNKGYYTSIKYDYQVIPLLELDNRSFYRIKSRNGDCATLQNLRTHGLDTKLHNVSFGQIDRSNFQNRLIEKAKESTI